MSKTLGADAIRDSLPDALPDALPPDANADAPSTRLSGLMKRIQAKANGFVCHFKRSSKIDPSGASGLAIPERYLYPGPVATVRARRYDSSASTASSYKTWNAPVRMRPDLQSVGFRSDKHVTCIEVTLVNNLPAGSGSASSQFRINSADSGFRKQSSADVKSPFRKPFTTNVYLTEDSGIRKRSGTAEKWQTLDNSGFRNGSGMRTYCFGEQPESPCGTLSSRSSSGASDPDSGYEETLKTHPAPLLPPPPESSSGLRSMFTPWAVKNPSLPVKVQAKRSTIRREKAFRNRNKKAREMERNSELLDRFQEIRKRLGEDADENADEQVSTAVSSGRLIQPLPAASVVKNLVHQWNTATGQVKPRGKIVPSRLNSKRTGNAAEPLRPPRQRQQQVTATLPLPLSKLQFHSAAGR